MAYCQTSQWVSTSPYVKLTVSSYSSSNTEATFDWKLEYIASSAANTSVDKGYNVSINGETIVDSVYDIDGKTGTHTIKSGRITIQKTSSAQTIPFTITFAFNLTWSGKYKGIATASSSFVVPAMPKYTISYNANGGSGAPSSQTKWYGTDIKLSSVKPTRTGYTFRGWATSSGSTTVNYASGATYSTNSSVTLYAVWRANTYTISYNINDGSGSIYNTQTKTYGVALNISDWVPIRDGYTFLGWGTSAASTVPTYSPGSQYTINANRTLYAIWESTYTKPAIDYLSLVRKDENDIESDEGIYAWLSFTWLSIDDISGVTVTWEADDGTTGSYWFMPSGSEHHGGTVNVKIDGTFDNELTYNFTIHLENEFTGSYAFATLPSVKMSLDFLAGGKGAAFGKTAKIENLLDIAWQTRFIGGILPPVLEPETDLNDIKSPNTYIGADLTQQNYTNCPVTSGTFTLVVESAGEAGQVKQIYTSCSKDKPERFVRFYYQNQWGNWAWANTDERVLYENSSGTAEEIELPVSAIHYRYLEIYFTDNNRKTGGYTKVWNPDGKTICLHIQEASSTIYSRQTLYTISGTTITPNVTNASYVKFSDTGVTTSVGTNYIRIVRIIGRA